MLVTKVKNHLKENKQATLLQMKLALKEDSDLLLGAIEILLDKKIISKSIIDSPPCENCAFSKSCGENQKEEELFLYTYLEK